jgi:hypothetical protein
MGEQFACDDFAAIGQTDVATKLAAAEQIRLLRFYGFGKLLDLIEEFGPLTDQQIACRLGISLDKASALVSAARALINGDLEWPSIQPLPADQQVAASTLRQKRLRNCSSIPNETNRASRRRSS